MKRSEEASLSGIPRHIIEDLVLIDTSDNAPQWLLSYDTSWL